MLATKGERMENTYSLDEAISIIDKNKDMSQELKTRLKRNIAKSKINTDLLYNHFKTNPVNCFDKILNFALESELNLPKDQRIVADTCKIFKLIGYDRVGFYMTNSLLLKLADDGGAVPCSDGFEKMSASFLTYQITKGYVNACRTLFNHLRDVVPNEAADILSCRSLFELFVQPDCPLSMRIESEKGQAHPVSVVFNNSAVSGRKNEIDEKLKGIEENKIRTSYENSIPMVILELTYNLPPDVVR